MKSLALLIALAVPVIAHADGAALYKNHCATCHGADGSGDTPAGKSMKAGDLRAPDVQKMTDAELMKVLADGKGRMPKSNLAADDAKAVIAFVRALRK